MGFPVGAFSWACCLHCARETHDVNGAKVHSAACDALAVSAPLPPAPAPVPTPTPLAPAPSAMHATNALPAPPPKKLRAATGVCALAGCSLPVYAPGFDYCTASHAIQGGALAPLPAPGRGYAPLPAPAPVVPAGPPAWSSSPLPPASPFQSPPAPTSTPAPAPAPAPSQPHAANRAAGDDQVDPAPWPCRTKYCARPRRVRYRLGMGFPVGAFSWVCCLRCAHETRDVNGVQVHSAECDALAVSAPAPPTVRAADTHADPAPAPTDKPTADLLSRRLAALERQDIEDALRRRAAAAAHPAAHMPAPPAAAPPPTPAPAPMRHPPRRRRHSALACADTAVACATAAHQSATALHGALPRRRRRQCRGSSFRQRPCRTCAGAKPACSLLDPGVLPSTEDVARRFKFPGRPSLLRALWSGAARGRCHGRRARPLAGVRRG